MGNRIIKESICTSESIDGLTPFQETFFYRLIVNCDDYGRFDARPKILASRLYPLKDVKLAHIEDALRALVRAGMITLYRVDGKPYLQMNSWGKHQRIRNSIEKYPRIPDDVQPAEDCGELPQVAASCGETRPESRIQNPESNPESNKKHICSGDADKRFDRFWEVYPKKAAKAAAKKAFLKINPSDELTAAMIAAVERAKNSYQWQKDHGQFIPHPATWLNQQRWEDEVDTDAGRPDAIPPTRFHNFEERADDPDAEAVELMRQMLRVEEGE